MYLPGNRSIALLDTDVNQTSQVKQRKREELCEGKTAVKIALV